MSREDAKKVAATYTGATSVCTCTHVGDSAYVSEHAGHNGHGPCTVEGCGCQHFTWKAHTTAFRAALDAAMAK